MRLALVLAAAMLLAGAAPAAADGPVSASATLDPRGITIGDRLTLTLVVEAPAGYQVTDTGIVRSMGDFEILESLKPAVARNPGAKSRYTFKYGATAFRVGDLVFPQIAVAYQGPNGETGVVTTAEIPIVVTSVIRPGESTDDIKPWKPKLRLPGSAAQIPALAIQGALALVVLAMLALIVWQTRRRRRTGPVEDAEVQLSPAQRAMSELNRVASLALPEKGRYGEHYELLSRALRGYVRDRFGLPATERTPKELRDDMLRAGIDRTEVTTIYEILRDGENARFHPSVSYPARAHHAVRAAMDVLRRAAVAEQYELMRQGQAS
jgi:hypothetical protein